MSETRIIKRRASCNGCRALRSTKGGYNIDPVTHRCDLRYEIKHAGYMGMIPFPDEPCPRPTTFEQFDNADKKSAPPSNAGGGK